MDNINIAKKDESSTSDTNGYKQEGKILFNKYITIHIFWIFIIILSWNNVYIYILFEYNSCDI